MAEQLNIGRGKVIGGSVLAFAVAVLLGNMTGPEAEEAKPVQVADSRSSVVYRIPVSMSQPAQGPADALVTVVQWCDFPDAGCQKLEPALQALLKRYPKELRVVFRHFATQEGPGSQLAHQFSIAASERGNKFWEARKLLLEHKGEVTMADLERYAGQLGLDWNAMKGALDANTYSGTVAADRIFAQMFEVTASPGVFANGRPLVRATDDKALTTLVESELARAKKAMAGGVQREALYAELTKNGVWVSPNRPQQ
jgi:protein-disulfide isomerase